MKKKQVFIGNTNLKSGQKKVSGGYVYIDNELYYRISNYDYMDPFFMSIVSNSDHWMYIWSNGALSAGRKNSDNSLFPYYTDDKIKDSADITGSKTIIFVEEKNKFILWEPFSNRYRDIYNVQRNCYKNVYGNKLIFEEINFDLQLTFRYAWLNSEKFGFIKRSTVRNNKMQPVYLNLLDGIQNILPYGVEQNFQNEYSTLVDAYKKNDLDFETNMGLYTLSSIPVDRAEPSESLKATTVWQTGVQSENILISSRQLDVFRKGGVIKQELDVRVARGAYFIHARMLLPSDGSSLWYIVSDINKDAADVVALKKLLHDEPEIINKIEKDIAVGTENLVKIVANADGLQKTEDQLNTTRHFSNVLFNVMRGGIFNDQYKIDTKDFICFVKSVNKTLHAKYTKFLQNLPEELNRDQLLHEIKQQNNTTLEKLFYEYLPLTFSRRHGDPSRPWNKFSIEIKGDRDKKVLNYQGNWRDIFQNWEALALSYPHFLESMITRFVNASTPDGYNPYRLTRDSVDWEILDPNDPWSYIGYWGDHQIIYLLKLLELLEKYFPGKLQILLTKEIFTYTNVPYRIKPYIDILADPFNTVDFDAEMELQIEAQVEQTGSDGKLIWDKQGDIYFVNLTEKLLVPILVKLSNFIPEAGIWMNTQRPEWNDANNALVGNGVSMVTLYYLRRHLSFCLDLFQSMKNKSVTISSEVADFFDVVFRILNENKHLLTNTISDGDRKIVLDLLGNAGSEYRKKNYDAGFSQKKSSLTFNDLIHFCVVTLEWMDNSIRANQREDKLYHAYNLIKNITKGELSIRNLYEMLEGQVAVLSSRLLTPEEVLEVLKSLRKSQLYREDQFTYILYPNRHLADFTSKNVIPKSALKKSKLLQTLIKQDHRDIIVEDVQGVYHFNGTFRNAAILKKALQKLNSVDLIPLVEKDSEYILNIYEEIFDHQSFTGRSGTFFKYEGLGSIYWHMVSKLLLAVQENYYWAIKNQAEQDDIAQLKEYYYLIKEGIGVHQSPELYGGFPTDPYSHTPAHAGVQQPGMTGQVKEDIISRFGELGIKVHEGKISFQPTLLRREEFLIESGTFTYYDIHENKVNINLGIGCLAFTFVQVPIIYHLADKKKIIFTNNLSNKQTIEGLTIDANMSTSIFNRTGEVQQIDVFFESVNLN